jgi:hypothetical protein
MGGYEGCPGCPGGLGCTGCADTIPAPPANVGYLACFNCSWRGNPIAGEEQ